LIPDKIGDFLWTIAGLHHLFYLNLFKSYDEMGRNIYKTDSSVTLKNIYQFRPFGPSQQEETRSGANFLTIYNDYNMYGSQTFKADLYEGIATVVRHDYDNGNRLKNVADAFDYFTNYSYNKTRVSTVQTNGAYQVTAANNANAKYEYEPDGKLKSITYPQLGDGSIVKSEYLYDGVGRLRSLTNKKAAVVLSGYQYTYDGNGNILTATEGTGVTTYQYDKLNRLISVQRPGGQTLQYSYDIRGNRSTLSGDDTLEDLADRQYSYNV